jgi:hypothetical protein
MSSWRSKFILSVISCYLHLVNASVVDGFGLARVLKNENVDVISTARSLRLTMAVNGEP